MIIKISFEYDYSTYIRPYIFVKKNATVIKWINICIQTYHFKIFKTYD